MSTVDNKKTRAMLEAATSPLTLVPTLIGATGGLAMFALVQMPILGLGIAGAALAWGLGTATLRGFSSSTIKAKVEKDILAEQKREKEARIEDLRSKLMNEEEALLDEILGLEKLLESLPSNDLTQSDINGSVKDLLGKSLSILSRVPMLNDLEDTVSSSKNALKVIREQKAKFVNGAKTNIEVATQALAELNSLGAGEGSQEEIRRQLSVRLDVAREFDGQLSALQLNGTVSADLIAKYSKVS